jgi:hypothetical protein
MLLLTTPHVCHTISDSVHAISGLIRSSNENTAVGIRHADHVALSIRKTSGGRSVGRVRSRTQTMEFFFS